jgi:hypothetical protein
VGQTNFTALGLKAKGKTDQTLFSEVINATTTFDPASLSTYNGVTSSAITVTGAALGDFVIVAAPYDRAGVIADGYVTATNTVKITLFNATGGTVDLASGTWKIKVLKG